MDTDELIRLHRNSRRLIVLGVGSLAILLSGLAGWAVTARIDGAVPGQGTLVVEGSLKTVQHLTGGTVTAILVAEGDAVRAGTPLLRLDDTRIRAELAIIESRRRDAELRLSRLKAELAGHDWTAPGDSAAALSEAVLHAARRDERAGRRAQMEERIAQSREAVAGYTAQRQSRETELAQIRLELAAMESLLARGLATLPRVAALRRAEASAIGILGQIDAETAVLAAETSETLLALGQIDRDAGREIAADLREAETAIAELDQRRTALAAELAATLITAPVDGHVHELAVHTLGGVVGPGQVLLRIVPEAAPLSADLAIATSQIDRIHPGAPVNLRLLAGNQRLAPVLQGRIRRIGRDAVVDQATGTSYYRLNVDLPPDAAGIAGVALVAGMPVQGFVLTGSQSPAEWLAAPLVEQMAQAWRER